jgi:uncharacterized protein YhjY with autotransporter beta-barrel domain
MTHANPNPRSWRKALSTTASAMALAVAGAATAITPAEAIPYRDDVGDGGSQAFAAGWDGVVQIFMWDQASGSIFFNCTGSMVNARTVLTAAHCLNSRSSEDYGFGGSTVPIIAYGPDTFVPLFNWIGTDRQFVDDLNGLTFGIDAIVHPDGAIDGFPFPAADVAMIATLDPLYTLPTYSMLFSPIPSDVFEQGVLVNQIGYGTFHAGSTDAGSINGKRRAGENMLGLLASQSDFFQALAQNEGAGSPAPSDNQLLYWTDFDLPDRTGECTRGADPLFALPNSISCDDWDGFSGVFMDGDTVILPGPSIDYFPGDALPNEVATAGGDSGGPLMAMNIHDQPLILGVLSGGFIPGFFHAAGQSYGEVSYYNPLFTVHDFISENNPYKYVSAVAGNGVWSDPEHWVQTMDPNYFIYDGGEIVNGLPDTPAEGLDGRRPTEGVVFDTPVGEYDTGDDAASAEASGFTATGDIASRNPAQAASNDKAEAVLVMDDASAPAQTATGGKTATPVMDTGPATTDLTASGVVADASGQLADAGRSDPLAQSGSATSLGVASGPGSTGFVPNNTFGAIGTAFANPAQFFEVTLDAAGTTTLDMHVEIDKLNIRGTGAALDIASDWSLFSNINVEVFDGSLNVDGLLGSRELVLWGGELTGSGDILLFEPNLLFGNGLYQPGTLFNIAGTVNPGSSAGTGTLTLDGDYVQASAGRLLIEYDDAGSDHLLVFGNASLAGAVGFMPLGGALPRYGDSGTFLTVAGTTVGTFDTVLDMPGVLTPVVTYSAGQASFRLDALPFATQATFTNFFQVNLADALDDARDTDYAALANIYGPLDLLAGDDLTLALDSMSPYEAVMFDRTARLHVNALNSALMGQLGGRFGASATDLSMALASAERHANGLADTQSMGGAKSLFRNVFSGGDDSAGVDNGFRLFGDIGMIHGTAALIYGTDRADVQGHFTLLGFEAGLAPGWSGGLAVGFADSEADGPASLGRISADSQTSQISAFASYRGERLSLSGHINMADLESDAQREVNLGGLTTASGADLAGDSIGGGIVLDYLATAPDAGFRLIPTASLEFASFDFDAVETVGGSASLDIAARDVESVIARLGATLDFDAGNWRPMIYVGVAQEMGDGGESYNAAFSDAPSVTFGAAGDISLDTMWIETGLGVERSYGNGSTLSLSVQTEIDRDYLERESATVSYALPF